MVADFYLSYGGRPSGGRKVRDANGQRVLVDEFKDWGFTYNQWGGGALYANKDGSIKKGAFNADSVKALEATRKIIQTMQLPDGIDEDQRRDVLTLIDLDIQKTKRRLQKK